MSEQELKPTYPSKTYCVHSHPFAYATLTDFSPGKGMLQIHSDWGTYSSFWGAIGNDRKIAQFLLDCDSSYVEKNLAYNITNSGMKKEGHIRLMKFMSHCWPKLIEEFKKDLVVP